MSAPLALTPGEPAGIGPDLALVVADDLRTGEVVLFTDPEMLADRARALGRRFAFREWHPGEPLPDSGLPVCPIPLERPIQAGAPDPVNSESLLTALDSAVQAVQEGHCAALVTGPVSKEVIARGTGRRFDGHTQYLADISGAETPVMMLMGAGLRVVLVTTHLPLRDVPGAITRERVHATLRIAAEGLRRDFGLDHPRLVVTGLNPHAGEGGQLGDEEMEAIAPGIEAASRELGPTVEIAGPEPADTAFTPGRAGQADAVVCMYHDQGLGPLKQRAFGRAVNVTLGLPFVRTSVDHGTALDLAGSGHADPGSLEEAVQWARRLAVNRARRPGRSGLGASRKAAP